MDSSPQLEPNGAPTIGPSGSHGSGRRILAAIGIVAAVLLVGAWWRRSSPEQCYRRGRDALAAGNLPAALREAERLIDIPGSEPQGRLLKGLSLVRSGKPAEALTQLEQASVVESNAVEASAAAAQCFYLLGRHLEAIDAAHAALARDANCLDARRWLAAAYYDLGATPNAVAELQQISAAAPADPRPDRLLGLIGKDGEQFAQAVEHYRESVRRDPQQPDRDRIHFELAESLIHLGRFDEALAVIEESERSAGMLTLEAECLHGLGKLDAAQEVLRSAVELDPQYFPARLKQGKLFLIAGQAADAERSLTEAAELQPLNSQVHFQLSQAWKRLEKPQQAAAELRRMREIQAVEREFSDLHETAARQPADAEVRYRLGELARDLGKPELAKVWYRAALAIDPHHEPSRAALATIP
jgi:tetratricopeptide (TPR) repeat protein